MVLFDFLSCQFYLQSAFAARLPFFGDIDTATDDPAAPAFSYLLPGHAPLLSIESSALEIVLLSSIEKDNPV
jgi:hypothetical protein